MFVFAKKNSPKFGTDHLNPNAAKCNEYSCFLSNCFKSEQKEECLPMFTTPRHSRFKDNHDLMHSFFQAPSQAPTNLNRLQISSKWEASKYKEGHKRSHF